MIIVILAKFAEGAWVTLLLIPASLMVFYRVKAHYAHVAQEIHCPRPLDLKRIQPPVVVVPVKAWNTISERALQFALQMSPDVIAVHISADEGAAYGLRMQWAQFVEEPIEKAGLPQPRLILLMSPYRRLFNPLINFINQLKEEYPTRQIAVIIPELVEKRWYQYLLHNQRATGLKAALLLKGDSRVVVINVPWYLGETTADPVGDNDSTAFAFREEVTDAD